LEDIERRAIATAVAQLVEPAYVRHWEDQLPRRGGHISRQPKRGGVESVAGPAVAFNEACPIQSQIHDCRWIEGVNVIQHRALVDAAQEIAGRNVEEPVTAVLNPVVMPEIPEQLVPVADIEVQPADFAVESVAPHGV